MNRRCETANIAQECAKTKYRLEKDGVVKEFDSEKSACEFLGVKQCSVAGAWRAEQDLNTLAVLTWGISAPELAYQLPLVSKQSTKPYFQC